MTKMTLGVMQSASLSPGKLRFFIDLRQGQLVFVTCGQCKNWPPEGYPLLELEEDVVKEMLLKMED